jgi:opacity protein-like surface antigen
MLTRLGAAAALTAAAFAASAQEKTYSGYLDLFGIPYSFTEGETRNPTTGASEEATDRGLGLGVRSIGVLTNWLGASFEYQYVELDETNDSLKQLRAGLGYIGAYGGVFVEYTDFDTLGVSNDGVGIHARTSYNASRDMNLYADLGYLLLSNDFQDVEGLEFTIGGDFRLTDRWVVFADFRYTDLEGKDNDAKIGPRDVRVGVRLPLGI